MTAFAFFRGEPAPDIDSIFVATNLALVSAAFVGLTFFGYFFDIFASVGFISLVFGLCRMYAATQRGRAVGNADYLPDFDPARDRWLAIARLRFVPDRELDPKAGARRQREYNRRLRRFLYAGSDAVMLEGVVERKSFMHEALSDLMVLVWHSETEDAARKSAEADLTRLTRYLAELDARLPDDGSVRMAFACTELDAGRRGGRTRPELAAGRTDRPGTGHVGRASTRPHGSRFDPRGLRTRGTGVMRAMRIGLLAAILMSRQWRRRKSPAS